jgi:hypothetical protein
MQHRASYDSDGGMYADHQVLHLDEDTIEINTDALLDWAGQLSFDKYHEAWERTAATVLDLPAM